MGDCDRSFIGATPCGQVVVLGGQVLPRVREAALAASMKDLPQPSGPFTGAGWAVLAS